MTRDPVLLNECNNCQSCTKFSKDWYVSKGTNRPTFWEIVTTLEMFVHVSLPLVKAFFCRKILTGSPLCTANKSHDLRGFSTIPGGAGFRPPTVSHWITSVFTCLFEEASKSRSLIEYHFQGGLIMVFVQRTNPNPVQRPISINLNRKDQCYGISTCTFTI